MALNLTIVKIHNSQDKTLLCRNFSTFEDCGLRKHFPLSRRVVENYLNLVICVHVDNFCDFPWFLWDGCQNTLITD